MIGETIRYYPIFRKLSALLPPGGTVLDVGTKGRGIGLYLRGQFVGLDLDYTDPIHPRMRPVTGSVLRLPFISHSFDVVVCSDVIEHLKPESRPKALRELSRVARLGVVVGFPSGEGAIASDQFIARLYDKRGKAHPPWLVEHMENKPVEPEEVEKILGESNGARIAFMENQGVKLGMLVGRMESIGPLKALSCMIGRLMPSLTGWFLSRFVDTKGPFARRIYTVILKDSRK